MHGCKNTKLVSFLYLCTAHDSSFSFTLCNEWQRRSEQIKNLCPNGAINFFASAGCFCQLEEAQKCSTPFKMAPKTSRRCEDFIVRNWHFKSYNNR
jgi:hypothetical protein